MLELLHADPDSDSSDFAADDDDDERAMPPTTSESRSAPAWQHHVADELQALHSALEGRARALGEREMALAQRESDVRRREVQLAKDEGLLRNLLAKEAGRLQRDAQVRTPPRRQRGQQRARR